MTSSSTSLLDVERRPRLPALVQAAASGDGPGWVGENRDALRTEVAEHGAVLVRGLGLQDADQVRTAFQGVAGTLMREREAFASRQSHADGVYSSTPWPANQPMCMHHELSYAVEVPGLMLFACLTAPMGGGATAVADGPAVLEALPPGGPR
jgi:alpha-ketoglutarate-dependent taurine dioxygenase